MLFEYDATLEKCPLPLLHMRQFLNKMNAGDSLVLRISDKGSTGDIPKLLNKQGWIFEQRQIENHVTEFKVSC